MRVAIVNDAALAVEALRRVVTTAGHAVVWVAKDGLEALKACARDVPDLILMDLLMPVMDGVECTRRIMEQSPCPILIVTSTVSGSYEKVYDAMALGALDATDTPSPSDPDSIARLLKKIATIGKLNAPAPARVSPPHAPLAPLLAGAPQPPLVAIGASTGGPRAVADVLAGLGPQFPAAVVICQHVDMQFAPGLATWLQSQSGWRVELAQPGARASRGVALLANTEHHLILTGDVVSYTPRPIETPFRPSVDVLFKSLVGWRARAAAVLLTGMGRDGAEGLLALKQAGWLTIAQDQASSVVYGMPRAAAELGAATSVLAIAAIAPALGAYFRR
jgi:two-component system response regulator WspF